MSFERPEFLAARRIPQLDRLVIAGRGDPRPVGAEAHAEDTAVCPLSVLSSSPLGASHSLIVMSLACRGDPRPVGAEAHAVDMPVCPVSVRSSSPLAASHNLIVLSPLAEAIRAPSGLKLTL